MNLSNIKFDGSWTLFLDRDGVINKKIENDYVKKWSSFQFLEGALDALGVFSKLFGHIVIVTNQQGIGKGLFTEDDLKSVHCNMVQEIQKENGRVDKIYFCGALEREQSIYRKPNIGMAYQAKSDFENIDFAKSIMIGDSISDMQFGKTAGMKTLFITNQSMIHSLPDLIDWEAKSIWEFSKKLI